MDNTKAMPRLVLKRGKFSRSSGQWPDEDYDVLADGKVVGRIYEDASASTPPELRWFWSVTEIVPATPGVTNGHAATLEEAMAKFRAAWEKARAVRSDRIPRWRRFHRFGRRSEARDAPIGRLYPL
jgi:hypothetical protein